MTFLLDNLLLIGIALASGGLLLWPLIRQRGGATALSPLEATQLINHRNAVVVDLRDEKAFALGSLTGARNVPFAKLAERAGELARFKARPVLLVCDAGQQSVRAITELKALGFDEAHALAGGVTAWKAAGLPLVQAGRDTGRPAVADAARKPRNDQRPGQRSKQNRGARTPPAVRPGVPAEPIAALAPADGSPAESPVSASAVPSAPSSIAVSPAGPATAATAAAPVVVVDASDAPAIEPHRVKELS